MGQVAQTSCYPMCSPALKGRTGPFILSLSHTKFRDLSFYPLFNRPRGSLQLCSLSWLLLHGASLLQHRNYYAVATSAIVIPGYSLARQACMPCEADYLLAIKPCLHFHPACSAVLAPLQGSIVLIL
eukprot:351039-Chlamydomonas_euryale.AAC.4